MTDDQLIKNRVRQQFGGSSAAYAVSATHRAGTDLERLVELAECRPDVEALDVAAGAGHTARAIAPYVEHVVVSDLTPEMLDTARSEMECAGVHNVSFRIADAEDLPCAPETFDLVTCRIAPHHFPNVRAFVTEVARVLRPGGLFMLIDSTAPDAPELDAFLNELESRRDPSHIRSLRRSEWLDLLLESGFDIEESEDFPKRHDFADWTSRSRMSSRDREELEHWMLNATPETRERFRIEVEDGHVAAFTDRKTLFKARKR